MQKKTEALFLKELCIPSNNSRIATFPNGRMFVVSDEPTNESTLSIMELNPNTQELSRKPYVMHDCGRFFNRELPIQTVQNTMILLFERVTLIFNIDTWSIERRVEVLIKAIQELDDASVVLQEQPPSAWYVADTSTLKSSSYFLFPTQHIHTFHTLSSEKILALTFPKRDSLVGRITIWEFEGLHYWLPTKSVDVTMTTDTHLKKLNGHQFILIVSHNCQLDSGYRTEHTLSLIDANTLTCRAFPVFFTECNAIPSHQWEVINLKNLLLRCNEAYFLIDMATLKEINREALPFQTRYPDKRVVLSNFTVLDDGTLVASTEVEEHLADSTVKHTFLYLVFFTLTEMIKELNPINSTLLQILPTALCGIIRAYCNDDFTWLIEQEVFPAKAVPCPISNAKINDILRPLQVPNHLAAAVALEKLKNKFQGLKKNTSDFKARVQVIQHHIEDELELKQHRDERYINMLTAVKENIKNYQEEEVDVPKLIDSFKTKHRKEYTSGFLCGLLHRTHLVKDLDYTQLNAQQIYSHACKRTFFKCKNRTRHVLEEIKVIDKKTDELLILEFIL